MRGGFWISEGRGVGVAFGLELIGGRIWVRERGQRAASARAEGSECERRGARAEVSSARDHDSQKCITG